jgi:plasmid stabilization system protein ParE
MRSLRIIAEAEQDYQASFDWYAERSEQAALAFAEAVNRTQKIIEANPERFVNVDRRHHALAVKKFPFRIIYRIEVDEIVIVAVEHAKRRSFYWRGR